MTILIVGNRGNMGSRYTQICETLGHDVWGHDIADGKSWGGCKGADWAIIATPVGTHMEWIKRLSDSGVSHVLCEKPITTSASKLKDLPSGVSMVNNWAFLFPWQMFPQCHNIHYSSPWSGGDGDWDMIQPVYLANRLTRETGPVFDVRIDGYPVTRHQFELSYVSMIKAWLRGEQMWGIDNIIAAHNRVLKWMQGALTL